MIYLDYSATTPTDDRCLEHFVQMSKVVGNANSPHALGKITKEIIDNSSEMILKSLKLNNYDCIYTSGSTEANNLAILGIALKYHISLILTTAFEHSSVIAPCAYLQKQGCKVDLLKLDKNGLIDQKALKTILENTNEKVLITIASVNSEIGILQDIENIKAIKNNYPNVYLHVDATQSIGKVNIDLQDVDLISLSAHKIYGIKGIGLLLKNKKVEIKTQLLGGKSTTKYRSGTPCHPLISSLAFSIKNIMESLDNHYKFVNDLNQYLKTQLLKIDGININSNNYSIPHILNISIKGMKSIDTVLNLSKKEIYISNHSACSSEKTRSEAVYSLTKDEERSETSVRISLSHLTSYDEVDELICAIKELL